jgi:hypothetical protein
MNMQFSLNRRQQPNTIKPIINTNINQHKYNQPQVVQAPLPQQNIGPKKMKWGEPTWFLLHTLAHKIKDENFQQLKPELLNLITNICANLPCPTCSEHAMQYIKTNPFYSIQSKQGLKDMLFKFHNDVNTLKGFAQFNYEDLDTKYDSANTINIIKNFMFYFKDKSYSIRMIANDMHRGRLINMLNAWFSLNIQYFNQ